jgi:hypothetical protein
MFDRFRVRGASVDILDLLNQGDANIASHHWAGDLRAAAEAFLSAYDSHSGYSVVAASPQAERVLGAAMMLRPELEATGDGDTVILDVNIASGTLLARAAKRLRDEGNSASLVGIALYSLMDPEFAGRIEHLDHLVVMQSEDAASGGRQSTQRRDRRIKLAG